MEDVWPLVMYKKIDVMFRGWFRGGWSLLRMTKAEGCTKSDGCTMHMRAADPCLHIARRVVSIRCGGGMRVSARHEHADGAGGRPRRPKVAGEGEVSDVDTCVDRTERHGLNAWLAGVTVFIWFYNAHGSWPGSSITATVPRVGAASQGSRERPEARC